MTVQFAAEGGDCAQVVVGGDAESGGIAREGLSVGPGAGCNNRRGQIDEELQGSQPAEGAGHPFSFMMPVLDDRDGGSSCKWKRTWS